MIKKHHLRLLAALVVVCYLLTASPLSAIAQGTRLASAVPSSAESGNQAGEIPAAEEEGEEPGDEAPEEPAEQPGGEPDEEPGEEPEDPEEQSEGEPGDDAPGVEEEPGEDEPGTAEPESLPATTGLTVRHILVTLDGEFVVLDETVVEGLEIGTTVYGSDFVGSFGLHRFLCSAPEELVLGEEGNVIELFYEMLENPDGLEGPRELPAPELLIPDNGLKRTVGLSGLQDREDEPGSLSLNKVATPVEGMPNRWKITLTLSGINLETTSDVVLVIDTSGSMGQGSGRMAAAKQAAEKFVESLLSSPNTKVALVSFADGVTAHLDGRFVGSDEKQELLNEINGLTANGGTFTQAAIRQARRLLEEASDADHKVIVLLSDGEPTYSYRIRTINDLETYVLAEWYWDWDGVLHRYWVTKDSLSESEFDYDTSGSGDGTSMTTYIGHVSNWYWVDLYYYHHGNSAVAESRFAKDDGITIYSIGLSRGSSGPEILDRIASPDKSYGADEDELENVFQEIAGELVYAARDAVVTDPIKDPFTIPPDLREEIECSEGTSARFDEQSKTITWKVDNVIQGIPLTLSYAVEIPLEANSGLYETNERTYLKYKNIFGDDVEADFPIPQVRYTKPQGPPIAITSYEGIYDGRAHSITVDQETLEDGDTVFYSLYSLDQVNWSQEEKMFTDVTPGPVTVYVKVTNSKYQDRFGQGTVTIKPKPITVTAQGKTKVYGDQPWRPGRR